MRTAFPRWFLLIPALFAGLLSSMPAPSQTEITIGAGTGTTPYPFATSYQDARTQVIYLASEIGSAYKITALSLDITTLPGQTMNNFTIRMRHTSLSAYPSPASWESSGWTTVYQATETITSTGWRKLPFTTPFQYNGVDNLMVDFSFDNASSSTDGKCRYSTQGTLRMIYYRTNGAYGDPLTWSGTTPAATRTNVTLNVKLEIGSVAVPTLSPDGGIYDSPQNVTVSCATPGATIHYTTNGIDPTENDPLVASGSALLLDHTASLKAKAWKTGLDPSAIREGSYRFALRVKSDGDDANDGLTWTSAKKTVQAGLDAALAGDGVWVKAGTYIERITLKDGVKLYGGFAGTETALSQRNWMVNRTVLDGGGPAGTVVTIPSESSNATRIDGFTVRNGGGYGSPGVSCRGGSPVIANNTIIGNGSSFQHGGGIQVSSYSSPTITGNIIAGNSAATMGGGIYCNGFYASPTITNNTVVGNSAQGGGGIRLLGLYGAPPARVSNNIIAFNSSGISYEGVQPVLRNNCVYGNENGDYELNAVPGAGDFSANPLLVSQAYGNLHIQPGSPCVNRGWNEAPGLSTTDVDGQPRIQDGTVDVGADESDGTTWPAGPYAIVRVKPTGSDANDGSTWVLAKQTVQAGLDSASAVGGDVWVAAGTYNERIAVRPYTFLYGGFAGTEASRDQRSWTANKSVLDGGGNGSVITVAGGYRLSAVDGFTIQNGKAQDSGGGISCNYSSPTVANNVITGNTVSARGGAVYSRASAPAILGNTITGNSTAGIYCDGGSPTIRNNRIAANGRSGVSCYGSSPMILNNVIECNSASYGGGICCDYASPTVTGNILVGNRASYGGGVYCDSSSSPALSNNIVAFSPYGGGIYNGGSPTLRNNDVFGNGAHDYLGLSAGVGDISLDPLFVNRAGGDYHLTASSPCREAGWNSAPGLPTTDMDGDPRIYNGTVDIGADEFTPSPLSPSEAKKQPDSASVYLRGAVVSTASPDFFYAEAEDRSSSIRVDKSGHGLSVDTRACVEGIVTTDSAGECHIDAGLAANTGSGHVNPLGFTHRNLGGGACGLQAGVWSWQKVEGFTDPQWTAAIGLNNIGLLVTVFGNVTFAGADYFYLDDGSKLNDDSGHIGVKVSAQGLSVPSSGFVKVTGISSCEKKGSDLVRLIRAVSIVPAP